MSSFVLVASAQATVTSSSITSPSDPYFGFDNGQSITVSGTSNGTSGDQVNIVCYNDNGSTGTVERNAASNVAVNADGSFSTSVALSQLRGDTCRLRAVDHNSTPSTGLASYSGPRVSVAYLDRYPSSGAPLYDYYVYAPQLTAADDYDSYAGCGLSDSYLFDPSVFGQEDSVGFYCNDYADKTSESNPARTAVLVDGHPAYAPEEEYRINSAGAGFEPLVINSVTQDSSNGNLTIVETDPLVRCVGDAYPATSSNCAAFVASGVQVKRTITQNDDGHIVYIRDAYSSTDGAAHSADLLMENDQRFFGNSSSQNVQYEFPGQSAFSAYSVGQSVSVPAGAPASILIQNGGTADGATNGGRGAITYAQTPSGPFKFGYDNGCCSDFDAPNTVSVPASGTAKVAYAYSSEFTLAKAQHDALVAQDAFQKPALKITSPRNHSKVKAKTRRIKVKGTASAGSGVKSVTVNGRKVTVSGGKFSTTVRLHTGKNTIKVKLTSAAGNTVRKSVTVTRVKAAKAKKKPAPTFTG
ncbi:MAG TPA: hypothetical protein VG405_07015 [Solirubrobacteraceae bacterium]|jgi:hypothetical protein|nr:hypothetical protein [Solirubrobacteraceae bacterium]